MAKNEKNAKKGPKAARPGSPDEAERAFAEIQADMERLKTEEVGRVNTDVPTAVSLVLGSYPRIQALIPEMKAILKHPPVEIIARMPTRALGLLYTHVRWVPRTPKTLEKRLEEALPLRDQLLSAGDAHVRFGQMDAEAIEKIREGSGHLDRANDLIALSALFRAHWDELEGQTPVTEEMIDRASVLGTLLIAELGAKATGNLPESGDRNWADARNRAFRLFANDYEEIRRAVSYLRFHEGDADEIAPSIYPRKARRSAKAEDSGSEGAENIETDTVVGSNAVPR